MGVAISDAQWLIDAFESSEIKELLDDMMKMHERKGTRDKLQLAEVLTYVNAGQTKKGSPKFRRWIGDMKRTLEHDEQSDTVFQRLRKQEQETVFSRLKELDRKTVFNRRKLRK